MRRLLERIAGSLFTWVFLAGALATALLQLSLMFLAFPYDEGTDTSGRGEMAYRALEMLSVPLRLSGLWDWLPGEVALLAIPALYGLVLALAVLAIRASARRLAEGRRK